MTVHVPQYDNGAAVLDYAGREMPRLNPYHAPCPECGAASGEYCAAYVDGVGYVAHRQRWEAAKHESPCALCAPQHRKPTVAA